MKSMLSLAGRLALVLRKQGLRLIQAIQVSAKLCADSAKRVEEARRLRYRDLLACLGVPCELLESTEDQIPREGHEPLIRFFQVASAYLDLLRSVDRNRRCQGGESRRSRPSPDWGGGEESEQPGNTGRDAEAVADEADQLAVALMKTVKGLVYTTAIACLFHEGAPVNVDGMPMSSRPMHSSGGALTPQTGRRGAGATGARP